MNNISIPRRSASPGVVGTPQYFSGRILFPSYPILLVCVKDNYPLIGKTFRQGNEFSGILKVFSFLRRISYQSSIIRRYRLFEQSTNFSNTLLLISMSSPSVSIFLTSTWNFFEHHRVPMHLDMTHSLNFFNFDPTVVIGQNVNLKFTKNLDF